METPIHEEVIKILDDNKATEIEVFNLQDNPRFNIADYVIVATGRSDPHLAGIAEKLALWVKHNTDYPYHTEGLGQRSGWVLLDMGVVMVHLFITDKRSTYNLEQLYKGVG